MKSGTLITRLVLLCGLTAMLLAGVVEQANSQGRGTGGIPAVQNQLNALLARLNEVEMQLNQRIDGVEMRLTNRLGDLATQVGDSAAAIRADIRGTHLVDPFDVAVNICATLGGGAGVEGSLGGQVALALEGEGGADVFGNGGTVKINPEGSLGVAGNLGANVGLELTACINGIFARQRGMPQEDPTATVAENQKAFVEALLATGQGYRDGAQGVAEGIGLAVNSLMDALQEMQQVDLGKRPTALFNGGFGPVSSLANSLPAAGLGITQASVDMIDIVPTSVAELRNVCSEPFPGLNAVVDGVCAAPSTLGDTIVSMANTVDDIEGTVSIIDDTVDTIKDIVDDLGGGIF